ncbi:hypothetical protein RvY_07856 [Ramazzottius varieornatus]|uniref:Uncharacterized protein n=1 Tax=Ramazzottius varieornatus TaxID=947166 RepID=A0A1D1V3Q9_RAMVA|nr:hypothetical protein RvY_07856 [Ramazzottius varieornatus]
MNTLPAVNGMVTERRPWSAVRWGGPVVAPKLLRIFRQRFQPRNMILHQQTTKPT